MTVYFLEAFFSFCKVSLFLLFFLSSFFRTTFTFYLSRLFIYNWLELLLLCDFISCRTRSLFDSFMNIVEILDNNRKLLKILNRTLKKTYKSIFSNVVSLQGDTLLINTFTNTLKDFVYFLGTRVLRSNFQWLLLSIPNMESTKTTN